MYSLFLCDDNHLNKDNVTSDELIDFLKEIQFARNRDQLLQPAESFMQHITFLGCSPSINHEIETQISIKKTSKITAIGGDSISQLSCPQCKTKINTPALLLREYSSNHHWLSPCCHQSIPINTIKDILNN